MPAELSDRLQASDAALAARVACGDPQALDPLYRRHRGVGLPLRAALVRVGGDRRRRDAGRVRAPADARRRLRRGARPAVALAARHRPQLRAPAHRRDARYVANDEDDEPPRPTSTTPRRGARDAARPRAPARRRSRRCRRTTATCSCWSSSPSARTPRSPRSAAASSTPCARACPARARSSPAGSRSRPTARAPPEDDHDPCQSASELDDHLRRSRTAVADALPPPATDRAIAAAIARAQRSRRAARASATASAGSPGRSRWRRRSRCCRSSCARCRRRR